MVTLEQLNKGREKKQIVTFSITEDVNKRFIEIAKNLKINKSLFVEEAIKEFLHQYEQEV